MADRIAKSREAAGLQQGDVADHLGISNAAYSKWESGQTKEPKPTYLLAFCDFVNADFRYVITGKSQTQAALELKEDLATYQVNGSQLETAKRLARLGKTDYKLLIGVLNALELAAKAND